MFARKKLITNDKAFQQALPDYDLSDANNHHAALFSAAKYGRIDLLFELYMNRVNLLTVDSEGNNALHIACKHDKQKTVRMLVVLAAPEKIYEQKNNLGKKPVDYAKSREIKDDLHSLGHPIEAQEDVTSKFNTKFVNERQEWNENERVLLALDGGGVRATITMQILVHLDALLNGELVGKLDDIAGTSCGGVIALLLTTNDRKITEVRRFLFEMKDRAFCKNIGSQKVYPKHNSSGIEFIAKHVTGWGEQTMGVIKDHRVMITVVDSQTVPPQLLLFRSFMPKMPEEAREYYKFFDPNRVELWKALRCTTAAPFFFESFNGLSDGGLVANNPTMTLMHDFHLVNQLEKEFAETEEEKEAAGKRKIGLVISLGTGIFPREKCNGIDFHIPNMVLVVDLPEAMYQLQKNPIQLAKSFYKVLTNAKNMLNILVKECTASNGQPVHYARSWCHSIGVPYFRFSPYLTQGIQLDDTDVNRLMAVLWETELYVSHIMPELVQLANLLKKKPTKKPTAPPEPVSNNESIDESVDSNVLDSETMTPSSTTRSEATTTVERTE